VAAIARCSRPKGPQTELLDLQGKLVLPGLIDRQHRPPRDVRNSIIRFRDMAQTTSDVSQYIQARAAWCEGQWSGATGVITR